MHPRDNLILSCVLALGHRLCPTNFGQTPLPVIGKPGGSADVHNEEVPVSHCPSEPVVPNAARDNIALLGVQPDQGMVSAAHAESIEQSLMPNALGGWAEEL